MTRRIVAALVILAWIAALGWNARRTIFVPSAQRLVLGATSLPTGPAYYTVRSAAGLGGMLRVTVDTLAPGRGFRIEEVLTTDIAGLGTAGRTEVRGSTWLDSALVLDSLHSLVVRGPDTARYFAVVELDRLRWRSATDSLTWPVDPENPPQTRYSWPLRFAAVGGLDSGERFGFPLFDPVRGTIVETELEVRNRRTVVFADSADTDSLTGRWIVAGTDTVQAWELAPPAPDAVGENFVVDEDGRYVNAELAGGLRLLRTAFELAFFADSTTGGRP